jgi:prophage regulatory protein
MNCSTKLPETGFIRLRQIIGDLKVNPPTPPIIPVCASSWWEGVHKNIYPSPVKLGPNTTAWRVEDILELIERVNDAGRAE